MQKLTLVFPVVEDSPAPEGKPTYCPRCSSTRLVRHAVLRRQLIDTKHSSVAVHRYRCSRCRFTFRNYPVGVSHAAYTTNRVVVLAALLRSLGLSCTSTTRVILEAEVGISQATIWRQVRKAGILGNTKPYRRGIHARVLEPGEEPSFPDSEVLVRFVEDPGTGQKVGIECWRRSYDGDLPHELHELVKSSGAQLSIVTT